MERPNQYVPPPPRLLPNGELRPIIEPPLREMVPFPGAGSIEEWEHYASSFVENRLRTEVVNRAKDIAMADDRVKRLLGDKRHIAIGASLLEKRKEPKEVSLLYVFYNYTDNFTVEVYLDHDAQQITDVVKAHYQPAPLQQEIEQAIAMARKDRRLADRLTEDLEGMAIMVSPNDPDGAYYFHRQFDVRFGCPDERLPRFGALVDLSSETVIRVSSTCAEGLRQEGRE
jgi:hypothetical protein